jgi:PAS domain S-box-containing protein
MTFPGEPHVDDLITALRESEELHRLTLLSLPDAVLLTTDDGAFTFIGPNVDAVFGYRQEEVRAMGRIASLLGCDLLERGELASTGELRHLEHEVIAKDRTRRALLVDIKRVSIRLGTILYVCRDITERKQADDLRRANDEHLRLALEGARRRLSGELHDGMGQWLALLYAEFAMLRAQLANSPPAVDRIDELVSHTLEVGAELHRLSRDLQVQFEGAAPLTSAVAARTNTVSPRPEVHDSSGHSIANHTPAYISAERKDPWQPGNRTS